MAFPVDIGIPSLVRSDGAVRRRGKFKNQKTCPDGVGRERKIASPAAGEPSPFPGGKEKDSEGSRHGAAVRETGGGSEVNGVYGGETAVGRPSRLAGRS
jgi:hypothetical protein